MTVKEIINELSILDQDALVIAYDNNGIPHEANVKFINKFFRVHIDDGKESKFETVALIEGDKSKSYVII